MANIWVVRAGTGGIYADEFEQIGIAAIGFGLEENASALKSRDAILSVLTRQYPNMKKGRAVNWASQLYRFVHGIKQGDAILTPIQDTREIMIGTCAGPYSDMDGPCGRCRARAHPAGLPDREQPQPDRQMGEHPQGGGRGRRGRSPVWSPSSGR